MAFSITAISRDKVSNNGGYELAVTGVYEKGASYSVTIGLDGICYSGIPDQGYVIYPENNTKLYAYTPLLDITGGGSLFSVSVVNLTTLESHSLLNVLTVLPKQYLSKVYSYRQMLAPDYLYGTSHIKEEE